MALAALDAQQSRLPETERGLGKEVADLRERLKDNPRLENDARFTTEVAWLVQDWKVLSGTGEDPKISPLLAAGLRSFATELPGLENEEMKGMLRQAGGLEDRSLARDIRQQALQVADMTPEDQASIAAARIAAVLDYRLGLANAA
ncbi:MAG: hypothetical protein ABF821_12575, partial [Gluconacetobacter sp.]